MSKSSSFYAARISKVQAALATLAAEAAVAEAREVLTDGQTYSIKTGIGESAAVVEGVLVGQRKNEAGVTEFRFQVGSGFDARFHDVKANRVVWPAPAEGETEVRSTAKIAAVKAKLEADLVVLETDLAAAEARETLEDGKTYTIRLGRADTKRDVLAVLLGQKTLVTERKDDAGNVIGVRNTKQLKFYYGSGFDAEIVIVSPSAVVVDDTAEADAPVDQTVAAE